MNEKPSGKLIVIEGLDKSGKTTQSKLLFEYYMNIYPGKVDLISFPDYTTRIGKEIKSFLHAEIEYSNEVKHILLSANRWEKKLVIEQSIKKNNLVLLNRYYQSNLVYGLANNLNLEWLINLDKGLPKENVVIVLDIDPTISNERGQVNNFILDEFEKNKAFLEKARDIYLELAKKFKWNIIKADSDVNNILKKIVNIIEIPK
ncbi:MAG TPA: dTMP kinase [Verrucomicrobiae bacterium]|nr:dTMP kinase [Verrucomicrobiae bacterium]